MCATTAPAAAAAPTPDTHPSSSSTEGPINTITNKAASALAPLSSTVRSAVPAAAPALDAAAVTLSRAARVGDEAYGTLTRRAAGAREPLHAAGVRAKHAVDKELATPEAVRLRTASVEFYIALKTVALLYYIRLLEFSETRCDIIGRTPEEDPSVRLAPRSVKVGKAIIAYVQNQMKDRHTQRAHTSTSQSTPSSSTPSTSSSLFADLFTLMLTMLAAAAARASTYRGEYHQYIVPAADWVSAQCDAVAPSAVAASSQSEDVPVGETIGTLPFSARSSEASLAGMESSTKTD